MKRAAKKDEEGAGASFRNIPGLVPTDTPGVYLNSLRIPVNAAGVALTFLQVKRLDSERFEAVIGEPVDTPAKFLKAVSLDPRIGMGVRIDAAKAAAPYTDRKMPIAVDGGLGADGAAVPLFDLSKLKGMPTEDIATMLALLKKNGVS